MPDLTDMATTEKAHYSPPWADTSIIGIAGSSGSGKTSLAVEIVSSLDLPWVVILSMDSFYKVLNEQQSLLAERNEYDFDAPEAIDFDTLADRLHKLKSGQRAEIPRYSFAKHQREEKTTSIYSPHVLILEGIFGLYDQRILDLLDLRIFAEADPDICLARRILRDVKERGRDVEGCIKQWTTFVKPNFERFVEPQRKVADIIVPRGIENRVAINMIVGQVRATLKAKSARHQEDLRRLRVQAEEEPLSSNVRVLKQTRQIKGMSTIIQNPDTDEVDFIFYFDRLASLLVERALELTQFHPVTVKTPIGRSYHGLESAGEVSAVIKLRGGSCLETGLKRVIPECRAGRMVIQSSYKTGEPELHYLSLPTDIASHEAILLLDSQMSTGGAALMAVRVICDHGVAEERITVVTMYAGKSGIQRLHKVFPKINIVVGELNVDGVERWVEERYFGC